MDTYLYKYEKYGKGEILAKYSGGYIHDLRAVTFEHDSKIIARAIGQYLQVSKKVGYDYADITVKANVAYKRNDYYLYAKNNIIYSRNDVELAQYVGNPQEALFAYAALKIADDEFRSSYHIADDEFRSSYHSSAPRPNGCLAEWIGALGLFLFIMGMKFFFDYFEYFMLLHIIIPSLVLVFIIIKRVFSKKKYHYSFGNIIKGLVTGLSLSFIIEIIIGLINLSIKQSILKDGRHLLVDSEIGYTTFIILSGIIFAILYCEEKK